MKSVHSKKYSPERPNPETPFQVHHRPRPYLPTLVLFLCVTTLLLSVLVYLASIHRTPFETSLVTFSSLRTVFREQGIGEFLEEKARLKKSLSSSLREPQDSEQKLNAEHLAVFMFPDLLPSEHFERDFSISEWAPLQMSIERLPGSEESQEHFEALRASIWNYESPDKRVPRISKTASDVIRLYEAISGK